MRIAVIGAGNVGTTLGSGWAVAGHQVAYGVRDASRAAPHAGATMRSVADAVRESDVVVLATSWAAVPAALEAAGDFGGKPLLDVTNPIGSGFTLTHGHDTSGAEVVASLAKNARVVKAFNCTGLENMQNPRYGEHRAVMPVAGDDTGARDLAVKLAGDLGFDPVALDALRHARELEPLAMLWISLAMPWGHGRDIAFGLAKRTGAEVRSTVRTAQPRALTVVGGGSIGGALAKAWLAAGHRVRLAARDGASDEARALRDLGADVSPLRGSAEGADAVVFAIPAGAVADAAAEMGALGGKVVVDCSNAIGKGFTLQYGHTTSSAEELAKRLPGARVVRAFNQQGAETLVNPAFGDLRAASFVAADDADARVLVKGLATDVGLDAVEAGPLASSRYLEPMTMLWIALSRAKGTREIGLTLLRR
jgi:8-hydroxy-5-deazaflavin:NADPH oxidoreductase